MRKIHPVRRAVLAGAATVTGVVLLLSLKPASDPGAPAAAQSPQGAAQGSAQGSAQESAQGSAQGSAQESAQESAQGSGQDTTAGTVLGDAVRTQYGPVQVRLTLTDGKITEAEAVQAPEGGRSSQVTADAVPRLNRAALTTGTADIDTVSGATYTSAGYKQSLQSALDKAGG
ncbi:FMN-binding protein [Streptomyces sp. NPDC090994]|uniref:FMN-binding protein n=1 Tax=Streptomyces sp. NPDC090994 TaxID=3365969 RepID=UPI003802206C